MKFKTLNGYDVSLWPQYFEQYPGEFNIFVSIHTEEHVTTSYILELNKQQMVDLINSLQNLVNIAE